MALPTTEQEWLTFLAIRHDADKPELAELDAHYEGKQPLTYMHPEILREVGDRIKPVVLFWPQLAVDSIEERLDPRGFRLPGEDEADKDMWRVWQANDFDEESQLGRVDALVMRRSYIAVGTNADDADTPLVTVESPLETYAYRDPRTRGTMAALKRTHEAPSVVRVPERYATLYLPNATIWYDHAEGGWREQGRDDHNLGEVPLVPMVNRSRTADRYGQSELDAIIPLSDAANKIATDMMLAAERVALPLRGFFSVGPDDLEDSEGNNLTAVQTIMSQILTIPDETGTAKHFEFTPANLSNFHETLNQLAKMVASMAGLPPHALGFTTDNPASADAIRSAESRLVKRAERKQIVFEGSYEKAMRLVRRFQSGDWDPRLRQLETIWRDASTPTVAQTADAAVKKYTAEIVPLRQTREDLGYTEGQIKRMEEEDEKKRQQDPLSAIERLNQAPGAAADDRDDDSARRVPPA